MADVVTVWVKSHPLKGEEFSEALRMSVGLTIAVKKVNVILSHLPPEEFLPDKAGVPPHDLHLKTLLELNVPVMCLEGEAGSIKRVNEDEAVKLLESSDAVIFY